MIRIEQASQADAGVLAQLNQHVHGLPLQHVPRFFIQPTDAEMWAAFRELLAQENV